MAWLAYDLFPVEEVTVQEGCKKMKRDNFYIHEVS
jgi:hypothetical protein